MKQVALTKETKKALRPALKTGAKDVFAEIEQGRALLVQTANKKMLAVIRGESRELVIVAAVGSDLFNTRQEFIDLARSRAFTSIRFHTTHPEHLAKGLRGLNVSLVETRKRLLGNDERVYKYQVL